MTYSISVKRIFFIQDCRVTERRWSNKQNNVLNQPPFLAQRRFLSRINPRGLTR